MTELLAKNKDFKWTPECEASFQELKKTLTTASVLIMLDMEKPFSIYCGLQDKVWDVCSCRTVMLWLMLQGS